MFSKGIIALLLSGFMLLGISGTAHAIAPQCFNYDPVKRTYTSANCDTLKTIPGAPVFQENKCYALVADSGGAGVGETDCSKAFGTFSTGDKKGNHQCGTGAGAESVSLNLGCTGEKCITSPNDPVCMGDVNAILDVFFAIIRFLSVGVGIIIVASVVVAGIQYTSSRGDPAAVAKAIDRVRNTVIGLVIYLLIYAILNWIVPAGVFN
jgi:hypothetical protein